MAGVYNEKQETRNEKAARLRDLKTEAVLLNKLENVRLQKTSDVAKERAAKTQRAKELEEKIKQVRQRNKEANKEDVKDFERLDEKRKRIENQIIKIQNDIKEGKFGKEEPKPPVILDKETQLLQDRLMQLKAQQDTRVAKADYEALSKWDKGWDKFWQVLGLRRLVNAAIDFSIPFRQANTITMNPFKAKTTLKSFYNMFNMSFSPEKFKRFQYQLENSNKGKLFEHFGGVFSNPLEIKMVPKGLICS
jgi:DNA repair exonuclease SbcCD ATPase subunit